jgi:hypothetical protein
MNPACILDATILPPPFQFVRNMSHVARAAWTFKAVNFSEPLFQGEGERSSQMAPLGPPSLKRPRASAPRSRKGCIPCRNRHVRCDEGQPVCAKCTRLGIRCHGHGMKPTKLNKLRSWSQLLLPRPRPTTPAPSLLIVPSYYTLTGPDVVYFDAFRHEVIHDVAGIGYADFWTRTVSKSKPYVMT